MKTSIVPVKKILNMINACENEDQLNNCQSVIENYLKSAKRNGLANIFDLKERLDEEFAQRQEELYLVKIFNK